MKTQRKIDFASLCKDIREITGFTQQKMADFLGVKLRTYQRYEEGKGKPSGDAAFRLAEMDICFRRSIMSDFIVSNIKVKGSRKLAPK